MAVKQLKLSVHQLVDFLLRSGDIDNRVFNQTTMQEGSRLHAYYQAREGDDYLAEYPLKHDFEVGDYLITLEGRADGIIINDDGSYTIDEIKTTVQDLAIFHQEQISWHLGQAKCYAFMFMAERHLDTIKIRLSYYRQGHKDKLIDRYILTYDEGKKYILGLIDNYLEFHAIIERHNQKKIISAEAIKFPFTNYRRGQKELIKYCYAIAKKGKRLYVEAPTGIGKTMSVLYPFIKSLKDNNEGKIFYLTAKNSGKKSAYNAVNILKEKGLDINSIVITAKEKICPNKEIKCNPDECIYALRYYSKVRAILTKALIDIDDFNYDSITSIALENQICPFEFELDLSLYCDIIICDYNYLFDPLVYMKRYFDEDASSHLALIDEAHNLIDRSRDMHSAVINKSSFDEAKLSLKNVEDKKIKRMMNKMNKFFKELKLYFLDKETILPDGFSVATLDLLYRFYNQYLEISKSDPKLITPELSSFFLEVNKFIKISELYDDNYLAYIKNIPTKKGNLSLHLLCLDASKFIKRKTSLVKGSVFFSATMSPMDYYVNLLGGNLDSPSLTLKSPFNQDHLLLLIAPSISVKYQNRISSMSEVASYIKAMISHKVGNYFIFAPSYEYIDLLKDYLMEIDDINLFIQERDMDDNQKEEFIANFVENPIKTNLGVAVLGGTFSEGIDLIADRLFGAVIIGVGLAKINFELDEIAKYYDSINLPGKDYAYVNPGMNKVMQAVGRVIRSEDDRGIVLLIDERYTLNKYQELYKKEWSNYQIVLSKEDVDNSILNFLKK